MKKHLTWLLFFGYFSLFVIAGLIFYFYYLDSYFAGNANIDTTSIDKTAIYFGQINSLYKVNPNFVSLGAAISSSERLQSTGEVGNVSLSNNHKLAAFSSKNTAGNWEIRIVTLENNSAEQITDQTLADYPDLIMPQFSPDSKKLAFFGSNSAQDNIFIYDLSSKTLTNLTSQMQSKFSTYSWSKKGDKIVVCTVNPSQPSCNVISGQTGIIQSTFLANVKQISYDKTDAIYFLTADLSGNIYSLNPGATPLPITNITDPKTVKSFDISTNGEQIVYEVSETNGSDIYTAKVNGTNTIQLTTDLESQNPVVSPDGTAVAFEKNDGIYTIKTDKSGANKILNLEDKANLFTWR